MKKNNYYESPEIKPIETRLEGIVCGSGSVPGLPPGHGLPGDQDADGGSD